jgi:LmbE family N-acetylglucosaminyl deacetylase
VRLQQITPSRVLVIAPHRDDEVIPCGGTLLLHQAVGSTLGLAFITDSGGPSSDQNIRQKLIKIRQAESAQVMKKLNFQVVADLNITDGKATNYESTIHQEIKKCITQFKPDIILTPSPADNHGDHQATAIGVAEALSDVKFKGEVWSYELWSTIWPNVLIDISSVEKQKNELIRLYASQMNDRDYASAILGLNRYRGLRVQVDLAEAFFVGNTKNYYQTAAELDRF